MKLSSLPFLALLVSACGPKALALPDDPIDRAATCGIVAAATARRGAPDVSKSLPFEAQGRIFHYALLAGSEGGSFSGERASIVSRRMGELGEKVAGGKWQDLVPACAAAFPEAEIRQATLPSGRTDALLGCDELARFAMTALESQESDYGNELAEYRALRQKLEAPITPGLRSRAGSDRETQQRVRAKALASIAKSGSPMAVLRQCTGRFE